jgi:hypothetical protein
MRFNSVIGIGYGLGLAVLSFMAAGAGHGTYLPLAVASAPLVILGVPTALLGTPVLWAVIGRLATVQPAIAMPAVLVHYGAAGWLVVGTEFGDRQYILKIHEFAPWLLPTWTLFYLAGQVAVWGTLKRRAA